MEPLSRTAERARRLRTSQTLSQVRALLPATTACAIGTGLHHEPGDGIQVMLTGPVEGLLYFLTARQRDFLRHSTAGDATPAPLRTMDPTATLNSALLYLPSTTPDRERLRALQAVLGAPVRRPHFLKDTGGGPEDTGWQARWRLRHSTLDYSGDSDGRPILLVSFPDTFHHR